VKINWKVDPESGCWIWAGHITKAGYGVYTKKVNGKRSVAHRVVYEEIMGPIPEGMTLDHRCRTRACVNPAHLEPVSMRTNVIRGTGPTAKNLRKESCKNGHPFTPANTWMYEGRRYCRECRRQADRLRQRRAS
jgi:hypothetical protein